MTRAWHFLLECLGLADGHRYIASMHSTFLSPADNVARLKQRATSPDEVRAQAAADRESLTMLLRSVP
jgi:hypothetical protein